jgi:hypothetical protein
MKNQSIYSIVRILPIFICSFLLLNNALSGQENVSSDILCRNENALIIKENTNYLYVGIKLSFINLFIEKEMEIKLLNEQGVRDFQEFSLPEPMDETYLVHSPDIRNTSSIYNNMSILDFYGKVRRDGAVIDSIGNNPSIKEFRTINRKGFFGNTKIFRFSIPGLKIGDVVTIKYKILVPFKDNQYALNSSRIFFHRKYPVKSLNVSLVYNKKLLADNNFYNKCPDIRTESEGNYIYNWHYEDLPGAIDEVGAHPYEDLPWFLFHPKLYETSSIDFDSFKEDFVKPWYILTSDKEAEIEKCLRDFKQGINNTDNYGYKRIAARCNVKINDSIYNMRIWRFQKWMADSVIYHPDTSYYKADELQLISKPGNDLSNGMIRDHNKDIIYAAMIPRLGFDFINGFLLDNRFGMVSSSYFGPIHENDLLYVIPWDEKSFSFVIPRSDRCRYYFDELPFYYEDSPVILLHPSDFSGYKRNFYDSLRIVRTPNSAITANLRQTSCNIDVNTRDMSLNFTTKTNLSGQYSTLSRCIYFDQDVDNTINPIYHHKFWEVGGLTEPVSFKIINNDIVFPFKTTVSASYKSNAILTIDSSVYEIDALDWFRHIIYPSFSPINRVTRFFPDFLGTDKYYYLLNFDRNMEVLEYPERINIENKFGTYLFNLTVMGTNKVLVTSTFTTKNKCVSPVDAPNIMEIFDAIKSRSEFRIKFKVLEK